METMKGTICLYNKTPRSGQILVGKDKRPFDLDIAQTDDETLIAVGAEVTFTLEKRGRKNVVVHIVVDEPAADHGTAGPDSPNENGVQGLLAKPSPFADVNSKLPYTFVKVGQNREGAPLSVVDQPVYHDGLKNDDQDRISGELYCTMVALTPLIVGNLHYKAADVQGASTIRGPNNEKWVRLPEAWQNLVVAEDKNIVEPLMLDDKRVAIQGPSIKGMLRQSLGALLSAPMERVQEQSFSYRPNINAASNDARLEMRPAIVLRNNGDGLWVRVLSNPEAPIFVQNAAFVVLQKYLVSSTPTSLGEDDIPGVRIQTERRGPRDSPVEVKHLKPNSSSNIAPDYYCFTYSGGIDGTGRLAGAFRPPKQIYHHVLVSKFDYDHDGQDIPVDSRVIEMYELSQEHLSDRKLGHLRKEHPLSKRADFEKVSGEIRSNRELITKPGQLVYVEVELDDQNKPQRIVSIGRHFYYRQRHVDTIRLIRRNGVETERPCLVPLTEEKGPKPQQLSGPRLLFGYVSGEQNPGTNGIGEGHHQRLAGRIAINLAVEDPENKSEDQRFVNKGHVIPLKILGSPKPSAAIHYLDQSQWVHRKDAAGLITYGDLPGADPPGELRGRKFYRHQPEAADDENSYTESVDKNVKSNQAPLARFISAPGSTFRFTLRFRDLRPWELGALLFALNPSSIDNLPDEGNQLKLAVARASADTIAGQPAFAHKLGLGRPLGLGSVAFSVDHSRYWRRLPNDLKNQESVLPTALRLLADKIIPVVPSEVLSVLVAKPPFSEPGYNQIPW